MPGFSISYCPARIRLSLTILLLLLPTNLWALTNVTLSWDANSEPDLAGYRVFYREAGQAYNYSRPDWEGTATTCTFFGLDELKTYYFVARAFNRQGYESTDSGEVRLDPAKSAGNTAPSVNDDPDQSDLNSSSGGSQPDPPIDEGSEEIPSSSSHNSFDGTPIADAGPDQVVGQNTVVTLSGHGSIDPEGDTINFAWEQLSGPEVDLLNPYARETSFRSPIVSASGATLIFRLTVTDTGGVESIDTCGVTVSWQNSPPQAFAGEDQTLPENALVILDGSDSIDIDGIITTYGWEQIDGPPVVLSDTTAAKPSFYAPAVGPDGISLQFLLTVTDDAGLVSHDACVVNIRGLNSPPVAVTETSLNTVAGAEVTLDGSSSFDVDNGIAAYHWRQIFGPPVVLSDHFASQAMFSATTDAAAGDELIFTLTVTDPAGLRDTVDVYVYIAPANEPPIADAGQDLHVYAHDLVTLDGSNSSDADDRIVAYQWTQAGGSIVTLSDPSSPKPSFSAPPSDVDQVLTFRLTVTDDRGATDSDTVVITVLSTPPDTVAPNLSIRSPRTNNRYYYTTNSTVLLRGTATDNVGVTSVSWQNSQGGTGMATGTSNWVTEAIKLTAGTNRITVTARDAAGNTGSQVLTVVYSLGFWRPTTAPAPPPDPVVESPPANTPPGTDRTYSRYNYYYPSSTRSSSEPPSTTTQTNGSETSSRYTYYPPFRW